MERQRTFEFGCPPPPSLHQMFLLICKAGPTRFLTLQKGLCHSDTTFYWLFSYQFPQQSMGSVLSTVSCCEEDAAEHMVGVPRAPLLSSSLTGVPRQRGGGRLPGPGWSCKAAVVCLWCSSSSLAFPGSLPMSTALSGLPALKIKTCYKHSFLPSSLLPWCFRFKHFTGRSEWLIGLIFLKIFGSSKKKVNW